MITRLFILAAVALAGCAAQPTAPDGSRTGPHLVYRDSTGNVLRQFDYPDALHCRKVEAISATARCQATPVAGLGARATLRYEPPGMLVRGQYATMDRCRADTVTMAAGVRLVEPCAPQ